jgi:hypothetical protein
MIMPGGGNCGSDLPSRKASAWSNIKKADTNEGCAGTTLELPPSLYSKSLLLGPTRNFLEGKVPSLGIKSGVRTRQHLLPLNVHSVIYEEILQRPT